MAVIDFIAAPLIAALAVWFIRMGVKVWRSPGGDAPLQLTVMGWDRAVLTLGIALAWMAVAVFGQALRAVTKSPVATWVFAVGSAGMFVFAVLFVAVWFFNRPRFLIPPPLRGLPGTLRASSRAPGGGEHTRR